MTAFDQCLAQSNISMIVVMYPSKKKRVAPMEALKALLNMTLPGLQLDLETKEGKFHHEINLIITQYQFKFIQNTLT